MAVSGVSGTSSATSSQASTRQTIADNFDTFLSLLTTQLKYQNPLDPLDTNQFTQQLVQFTGVEQQLKTNDFLEAMMQTTQNASNVQAVSYIGKEVTSSGKVADLTSEGATWAFNLKDTADSITVTVKDDKGNVVFQETAPGLEAGPRAYNWNGIGSDGNPKPNGKYSIEIQARDAENNLIPVTTEAVGKVTSVDLSGKEPVLLVGKTRIPLANVLSVREYTPPASDDDDA